MENYMLIEVPCKADNIALLRVAVASFASKLDFTVSEIEEIKVAISEAVSNAVLHAYEDDKEGTLEVAAYIFEDHTLEITVRDQGRGIADIEQALEPAYTTTDDRMGLGLTFIDSFMDEFIISSSPDRGTEVMMCRSPRSTMAENSEGKDSGRVG